MASGNPAPTGASARTGNANTAATSKPNLIDSYGLGKYRNASGDHIKHYVSAADRSFSDYKKTGNADYYKRHREYADTARQFHKQTATKGTRLR